MNPDSIRLSLHGEFYNTIAEPMVWVLTRYMVKALFLAGHDTVVLDATNTREKRRAEWLSPDWETVIHEVPTNAETCKERAVTDNRRELLSVIDRMVEGFETPHNGWKIWAGT